MEKDLDAAKGTAVAVWDEFVVIMPTKNANGQKWFADFDPRDMEARGHEIVRLRGETAGIEMFRFAARRIGEIDINFWYRQPFTGIVDQRETFRVQVHDREEARLEGA